MHSQLDDGSQRGRTTKRQRLIIAAVVVGIAGMIALSVISRSGSNDGEADPAVAAASARATVVRTTAYHQKITATLNRGGAGAGVIVQISPDGSTWRDLTAKEQSQDLATATATGLINGHEYTFRVANRTADGQGAWSYSEPVAAGATCSVDSLQSAVSKYIGYVNVVTDTEIAWGDDKISARKFATRTAKALKSAEEAIQNLKRTCFFIVDSPDDAVAVRRDAIAHFAALTAYETELFRYLTDTGRGSARLDKRRDALDARIAASNASWQAFADGSGNFSVKEHGADATSETESSSDVGEDDCSALTGIRLMSCLLSHSPAIPSSSDQ